ncbi:MAG: ABC transporter permease [Desulfobacterales bacterium CG23_combo_of_CG06-09_8_20_14_all_51_8]|nr:MAG: ABC transporter permease [Desulfobacterales bacterium CG23_combo_of_CG06-09_8_20_14_all_51_8]
MDYIANGFFEAFHLLLDGDPETFSAIWITLQVSGYAMAASLMMGVPLGFFLGFYEFAGKRQLRVFVDTMLSLPTVFIGLMVYVLLSKRGPLGEWDLLFTPEGIAIGLTILALPIIIALTATAVESAEKDLILTLLSLGANQRQMLLTTLWETRFGLIAAGITAYGRVMTEVGISMMVGGNIKWHTRTITTAIALETNKGAFSTGVALGIVLLLIALFVNISVSFLRRK